MAWEEGTFVSLHAKLARLPVPSFGMVGATTAKPLLASSTPNEKAPSLGFFQDETGSGVRHRRLTYPTVATCIGQHPLQSARQADARILAIAARCPALLDVPVNSFLYVDTETTGLARGTGTVAFLVGLGWFTSDGNVVLEQLLLRDLSAETPLLERVHEAVANAGALVSFNGVAFDVPLLQTRLMMNRLPPLPALPHLDLLPVARRLHGRRFGGCRLGTIEANVLGFVREGDIAGRDVAACYRRFLQTGDDGGLAPVIQHNALDVLSMVALVGLYGARQNRLNGRLARPLQPALPGFERLLP